MNDFQQTVDLREKLAKQKREPAKLSPIEKIYQDEEAEALRKDLQQIKQPKQQKISQTQFRLVVFILALLVLSATGYLLFFKGQPAKNLAKSQNWYAVKLVDGEIFYGQVTDTKADPVVVSNVYYDYDQTKAGDEKKADQQATNIRLVKRGKETHGPSGTMEIVRVQVLLMEQLKTDSKVLKAILEYEK